jgi:hypothetical protein
MTQYFKVGDDFNFKVGFYTQDIFCLSLLSKATTFTFEKKKIQNLISNWCQLPHSWEHNFLGS